VILAPLERERILCTDKTLLMLPPSRGLVIELLTGLLLRLSNKVLSTKDLPVVIQCGREASFLSRRFRSLFVLHGYHPINQHGGDGLPLNWCSPINKPMNWERVAISGGAVPAITAIILLRKSNLEATQQLGTSNTEPPIV